MGAFVSLGEVIGQSEGSVLRHALHTCVANRHVLQKTCVRAYGSGHADVYVYACVCTRRDTSPSSSVASAVCAVLLMPATMLAWPSLAYGNDGSDAETREGVGAAEDGENEEAEEKEEDEADDREIKRVRFGGKATGVGMEAEDEGGESEEDSD